MPHMAAERITMESKVLLSPEDLEIIKSQIKAEVIKELTNKDFHTHMEHDPFNEVRRKYAEYGGPLVRHGIILTVGRKHGNIYADFQLCVLDYIMCVI